MFFTFEKIKELADKQGISLNKLEEKLGFSRNTIYNMKKSTPNVERVSKIADFLMCPPTTYWDARKIQILHEMVMLLHHWTSEILLHNQCCLMGNH